MLQIGLLTAVLTGLVFVLVVVCWWRPSRALAWCVLVLALTAMAGLLSVFVLGDTKAPLEEPAAASATPNPSNDPWYLLGLQEVLVYCDPWLATVGVPWVPSCLVLCVVAMVTEIRRPRRAGSARRNPWLTSTVIVIGFGLLLTIVLIAYRVLRPADPSWDFYGPF